MTICILFVCFLLYTYMFNKYYILNALIILEAMMLITMIFVIFSLTTESKYMFLLILTFAACEASIGLSLLVSLIRFRGNNFLLCFL
uniref:NADH dehydrogenase subunit 4L n=1 Tax=Planorbella duryi TaxID=129831 RepID=A0A1S6PTM7_9GAST|nr:NADH dehydrogenase subunit 4L [Planorbella duryi]